MESSDREAEDLDLRSEFARTSKDMRRWFVALLIATTVLYAVIAVVGIRLGA